MKKTQEFITRQIADEYILVPTGHTTEVFNGVISLSETGSFIYEHIEECESFEALISLMSERYEADKNTIIQDAVEFINRMLQSGLLTFTDVEKKW